MLDLSTEWRDADVEATEVSAWSQLSSLERVEVNHTTGTIMAQLDVGPTEAGDAGAPR